MAKPIKIMIAEPCHQNWADMTANQQGAFCQSCQKNVIDFTGKTQNEIYEMLSGQSESTCGRFNDYQIETPIVKTELNPSLFNWRSIAASLAAFVAIEALSSCNNPVMGKPVTTDLRDTASRKDSTTTTTTTPTLMLGKVAVSTDISPMILKGKIVDSKTHKAVPFASVYVAFIDATINADGEGNFSFSMLPKQYAENSIALVQVSGIAHLTRTVPLSEFGKGNVIRIALDYQCMPVMGLVRYVEKQ